MDELWREIILMECSMKCGEKQWKIQFNGPTKQ